MTQSINEPISVVASSVAGRIIPRAFSWHGRKYEQLQVSSQWPVMEGKYAIRYFSLFDGSNLYKVRLQTELMIWELVSII